jgi:outer membrane protein
MSTGTAGFVAALVSLLLAAGTPAGASGEAPRGRNAASLTIDEAVSLALDRNLSLEAARLDYESANWGVWSARASLLPSVHLSSTARRVDPETYRRANASLDYIEQFGIDVEPFLYETTYETGFNLTVPIWNGGRLWGALGAASEGRSAAGHAYQASRRAVAAEARSAYFGVLRAQALLEVSMDAVDAARGNAASASRKHEAGLVPTAEVLRWEVMAADEERGLAEAEGALTVARTRLANVVGVSLDETFELTDVDVDDLTARYQGLAWLMSQGDLPEPRARQLLARSPEFASLADATGATRAGVAIARGAFLPALNASGSYGWKADDDIQPDDETAWSVTVALDLPVFTSFKNLSDYQQSKRVYLAALRRQQDTERSMVAGLRAAVSALTTSEKALHAAERQRAQSEDHLRSVTDRYNEGMAPYTEFADARVLYDRSRVGYVNAVYDGLLAVAEVERILGDGIYESVGEAK